MQFHSFLELRVALGPAPFTLRQDGRFRKCFEDQSSRFELIGVRLSPAKSNDHREGRQSPIQFGPPCWRWYGHLPECSLFCLRPIDWLEFDAQIGLRSGQ